MSIFSRVPKKSLFTPRRVKTATYIQMELTECGAVSLSIVLAYFRKYVPIEELRIECNITRDGSNAANIVAAAEHYGLLTEGYSLDIADIDQVSLPAIIHWNLEHFVVLEGFGDDFVYINDPGTGPRTVTAEEFNESFSGITLCFEPGEDFTPSGSPPNMFSQILERITPIKTPLIYAGLASLCLIIPGLALPAINQIFVDQIIINKNYDWALGISLFLIGLFIVEWSLHWLEKVVLFKSYIKMSVISSSKTFWHMLRLPYSYYTQRLPGEIAYRLGANEAISNALSNQFIPFFISAILIVFYGLALIYYNTTIALIAFATILANFLVFRAIYRSKNDALARLQADSGKTTSYALGILENIENIKEMGMEYECFPTWAGYYTKTLNSSLNIGKKDVILGTLPAVFEILAVVGVMGIGGFSVINGTITIGMLIAIQILMRNLLTPLMQFMYLSENIQFLKVNIDKIHDVLKYEIDPQYEKPSNAHTELKKKLEGYLAFDNLTFSYGNASEDVLKNIHFEVSPGKSIALVGKSGSGKSTIAKLIAGLYPPREGVILFDQTLADDLPNITIRSSLSVVEQKPFIFRGTAKENLTMLDPSIKDHDIIDAAKDACIHEMILGRKGGYDFLLDQDGMNISGGERQCFEIARGLVKNPSILVLDEATSSLDSAIEHEIIKRIRRRGVSIIMIAHRLSTIKACDEIIVLDKGVIVAKGTHDELLETSLIYSQMIQSESGAA